MVQGVVFAEDVPQPIEQTEEEMEALLDATEHEYGVLLVSVSVDMSAAEVQERLASDVGVGAESVDPLTEGVMEVRLDCASDALAEVMARVANAEFVEDVQPNYVYRDCGEVDADPEPMEESGPNSGPVPASDPESDPDPALGPAPAPDPASGPDPIAEAESDQDPIVPIEAEAAHNDTYAHLQWNLESVNAASAWDAGYTGSGVSVAVIDAGFDVGHPDLQDRFVGAYNVLNGSSNVQGNSHGLEVAGIIAAIRYNSYATSGIAPDARVVPVLAASGGAYTTSNLVKAFDYIMRVRDQYNIRSINMSFGFDWSNPSSGDLLVYRKIDEAYAAGIVSVASAGNNGRVLRHCPCDYGTVVGVMGLEYTGFDASTYDQFDASKVTRCPSSNYNGEAETCKNMIAPGFYVPNIRNEDRSDVYAQSWGTSFAAPHVAATLALMFQANPGLSPAQAISALYSSVGDMGSAGWDCYYGYGQLNVAKAVDYARNGGWLEGPAFIAVGANVRYIDGEGQGLTDLRTTRGAAQTSVSGGVGTVRATQQGVLQLAATSGTGTELRAEVSAVGPIQGSDSLLVGGTATFGVAQPYAYSYVWSANDGGGSRTGTTFSFTPSKAGTYIITATLVADPSVRLTKTVRVSNPASKAAHVAYRTHVQKIGWESSWAKDGGTSGTTGKSRRLESLQVKLDKQPLAGGIEYRSHVQKIGWESSWSRDGASSGTTGQSKRLEAVQIRLYGQMAEVYDVWYRTHAQSFGWMGWAKNGERAGTATYGKRLEAIEVKVLPKGSAAPGTTKNAYVTRTVSYSTHVQTYGWQSWRYDGSNAGTTGQSKRLEAIKIKLADQPFSGGIRYRTHVQKIGWQGWSTNGALGGTTGQSKRLEAIRIELTGQMAEHYDVWYCVHAQTYGWLGWAKNGESAGTAGLSRRLECLRVVLLPKGSAAPGSTNRAFVQG